MPARPESSGSRPADYWNGTRRPLVCLFFLAPLLTAYEAGVLWLGGRNADSLRNGADYWMRGGLDSLGLNNPWLLPGMIVVGLLVWHIARQEPWRVSPEMLGGMLAESLLFAFTLVVFGQLEDYVLRHWVHDWAVSGGAFSAAGQTAVATAMAPAPERSAALAIVFTGAGIYEEVLFRLCLLPLCYAFFRCGGLNQGWATGLAIVGTSLAFSLAHYFGPAGEPFRLFTFWFRTVAGLFFAALFVLRGFGITVGAHAAYDLIVGLLLGGAG